MNGLCWSLYPIIAPLVLFERRWDVSGDNRVHRPLSGAAHLLRFQAVSRGVSRFKPDTLAHIPNLSNDLEKRVFLVAIKDTITVPNHSPWGWTESSQWLWQPSITQRGVSVTPEGLSPVRHGLRFGLMHHNAGFILMLLNSDLSVSSGWDMLLGGQFI